MRTRARSARRSLWIPLLIVLVVGLPMGLGAVRLASLARTVGRLKSQVATLRSGGSPTDRGASSLQAMRALRQDMELVDRDVRALYRSTSWLSRPISRVTWWPWLRSWGLLLDGGLGAAAQVTTTAWWVALSTESAIEKLEGAHAGSVTPVPRSQWLGAALEALGKERANLIHAREDILRAQQGFAGLRAHILLGGARSEKWAGYLKLASLGLDGLIALPGVAEPGIERSWLVLIQNSDELRATGGFVSSVAVAKFRGSDLLSLRYMNSYDVESYHNPHPVAPDALQTYMKAGMLLFRDANWSPDYPASAEVLASLFEADMGERVDGVVAIDTTFVELLLAALGPLPVPQYGVTVTAENVIETAIGFWNEPLDAPSIAEREQKHQEWLQHRKDFGGALVKAGLERLSGLSLRDALALAHTTQQAITGKHLLAWSINDPVLQSDLRRARLDGGLVQTPGDYLMVVDSNVGWNKADRYIERSMDYRVTLAAQGLRARLCVTYENLADVQLSECIHRAGYEDSYEALAKQCYWNYVRVLAPLGSDLRAAQGAEGSIDVGVEGDKTSIGALLVVPPGQSRTLCLEYDIPADVLYQTGQYNLFVQKQPGTGATPLAVTFTLDKGKLRRVEPWTLASSQQAHCSSQLQTDRSYAISWRAAGR